MLPLVTAAEMRELDRKTIEEIGIPGAVLMETAGRRLAGAILELDDLESIAIVCGGGNNGGDGFVCARVLRERGLGATVYLAADPTKISGDAATHLGAYRECGGVIVSIADETALESAALEIGRASVVVDALFGTGLTRVVTGHYGQIIEVINDAIGVVVACDVPSGLDADSGQPLGACVRADLTVTMAFAKRGLVGEPGFTYAGDVQIAEIGIPSALGAVARVGFYERADAADALPWPSPTDHKNARGHVIVLGGSPGRRGAGRLAARSALRTGAGLVTWASPSAGELASADPVMTIALDSSRSIESWLPKLLERSSAIVLGPGMADDGWGKRLVNAVLEHAEVPLVIDADGLNHLAENPTDVSDRLAKCRAEVVLTPHPGEAARLLATSSGDVQSDRLAAARRLAETGAVVVLKGARTIVDDGAHATLFPTGNVGMATAGSGDVLAGMIGALLAQGMLAADAATLGVYLHGAAGDIAIEDTSTYSLTADDIVGTIGAAIAELEVE